MTDRYLDIAKWQIILEETFGGARGNIGTATQSMYRREAENILLTSQRCQGGITLLQSFYEFSLRTFAEIRSHRTVLNVHNVAYNLAALRRLRAAWLELEHGYYFDGASHLRAVFETTMYLGAVLKGLFWFDELHSIARTVDLGTIAPEDLQRIRHQHVTKVNQRVARLMYGEDSALDSTEQLQMRLFLTMQHMHVHRGESNVAHFIVEMVQDKELPDIVPEFDIEHASIFMNVAACAAWTHHRTLKYLSEPAMNSSEWQEQWGVLDNAFRFWVDGWEAPFAEPMLRLMNTSFTFDSATALSQLRKTQESTRD